MLELVVPGILNGESDTWFMCVDKTDTNCVHAQVKETTAGSSA